MNLWRFLCWAGLPVHRKIYVPDWDDPYCPVCDMWERER